MLEVCASAHLVLRPFSTSIASLVEVSITSPLPLNSGLTVQVGRCQVDVVKNQITLSTSQVQHMQCGSTVLAVNVVEQTQKINSPTVSALLAGHWNSIPNIFKAGYGTIETAPMDTQSSYTCHPAVLDSAFHLAALHSPSSTPLVPIAVAAYVGTNANAAANVNSSTNARMQLEKQVAGALTTSYGLSDMSNPGRSVAIHSLISKPMKFSSPMKKQETETEYLKSYQFEMQAADRSISRDVATTGRQIGVSNSLKPSCMFHSVQKVLQYLQQKQRGLSEESTIVLQQQPSSCTSMMGATPASNAIQAMLKSVAAETNDSIDNLCYAIDTYSSQSNVVSKAAGTVYDMPSFSAAVWSKPKLQATVTHHQTLQPHHSSIPHRCIITGATGALGTLVAAWVIEDSGLAITELLLLGRNVAANSFPHIHGSSVPVTAMSCDSSLKTDFHINATTWHSAVAPIFFVHAAGVLEDGLIQSQTSAKIRRTMAAKYNGYLNTIEYNSNYPILGSGLFSSVAALLGNAGQTSYAASNGALDGASQYSQSTVSFNNQYMYMLHK